MDMLVLRIEPETECNPRSGGLVEIGSAWFMVDFPEAEGTHLVAKGMGRSAWSMKTWTWNGKMGASHNLGLDGSITIESRDEDAVRGRIDAVVSELYGPALPPGELEGRFVAEIVDCSEWKGPYPM